MTAERACGRFVRFWASGGAKFSKMVDSLPWTPINRRAKFYAASFSLGGEIRNRTNTQTVTDISKPCLSARVDNNASGVDGTLETDLPATPLRGTLCRIINLYYHHSLLRHMKQHKVKIQIQNKNILKHRTVKYDSNTTLLVYTQKTVNS